MKSSALAFNLDRGDAQHGVEQRRIARRDGDGELLDADVRGAQVKLVVEIEQRAGRSVLRIANCTVLTANWSVRSVPRISLEVLLRTPTWSAMVLSSPRRRVLLKVRVGSRCSMARAAAVSMPARLSSHCCWVASRVAVVRHCSQKRVAAPRHAGEPEEGAQREERGEQQLFAEQAAEKEGFHDDGAAGRSASGLKVTVRMNRVVPPRSVVWPSSTWSQAGRSLSAAW